MARTVLGTVLAGLIAGGLTFVAARRTGPLPPLGPLLDPVRGAVAAVRTAEPPDDARDAVAGLGGDVRLVYDDRGVPHIFAGSRPDAWRALGYAVARDRWFQMELTYRAAAGTLTELAGPRVLELDREARRLGLAWAAERKWAALPADNEGRRAMEAFAEGANAWRATMTPATTPVEYKLLGVAPMPRWEPKYASYLLMRMALTLAHDTEDLERTQVAALVGRAAAEALFPRDMPLQEPIQPVSGRTAPREAFGPLPPPGTPDSAALGPAAGARAVERVTRAREARVLGGDALGSNNWAVAPARSANGTALLANDPHLDLTLPSIWYEAHLVVQDSLDVYGVTFPGAPTIIIGFNKDVAWGVTNTGGDVGDWYVESVDDPARPTRYRVDGAWRDFTPRTERFLAPDGSVLAVDTMLVSHRGPVVREDGRVLSYRWTAHDPSREIDGFLAAARATSVAEWQAAMLPYRAPTQNMLVADRAGTIAIRSHGAYPVRGAGVNGGYVVDGRSAAADWQGELPLAQEPQATDPAQGFLVSANQQPFDPAVVPTYIGGHWADPWRAMRLNELLRADARVTPDAMRRYQTDPLSARARTLVPLLLAAAGDGDARLAPALSLLRDWDFRYTLDARAPVLFQTAMRAIARRTWDELVPPGGTRPIAAPTELALVQLLRDSSSVWWDARTTPTREDRRAIVVAGLAAAYDSLVTTLGPIGPAWAWERAGGVNVNHLLRLPGFSRRGLPVTSGNGTVAPAAGAGSSHGASWRMVVELGRDRRTAWAIYPGGQSGNPASRRYADRLERWRTGQLDSLLVPPTAEALPRARVAATLVLSPR
jgi:penicillin amidase